MLVVPGRSTRIGAGVIASAVLLVATATAALATPGPSRSKIAPGTYSGTVRMSVNVGGTSPYYPANLSGAWKVTVDKLGHFRGSERLQANLNFTSPDSSGCTYSPTSWTLVLNANLGMYYLGGIGSPGTVQGSSVVMTVEGKGWSTVPAQYTRTCGSYNNGWPFGIITGSGITSVPFFPAVHFPLGLFENRGHPYTVQFKNILNGSLAQTYTLTS